MVKNLSTHPPPPSPAATLIDLMQLRFFPNSENDLSVALNF